MVRLRITISALAAWIALSAATLARAQEVSKVAPAGATSADEQAVRQVTQNFVKAFNAGNAEKAAALFFSGAELIDDAGNVHKGTAAIKDVLGTLLREVSRGNVDHDRRLGLDGQSGTGDRGGPAAGVRPKTTSRPPPRGIRS